MQPDAAATSLAHCLALRRLVKMAQAILRADGPSDELDRMAHDAPLMHLNVWGAHFFAQRECRGDARDAWPMLATACDAALRHMTSQDRAEAGRESAARWQMIVGALLPLVTQDWQAWRDAVAPKLGGQRHG